MSAAHGVPSVQKRQPQQQNGGGNGNGFGGYNRFGDGGDGREDEKDREIERLKKELEEVRNALKSEQERSAKLQAEVDRLRGAQVKQQQQAPQVRTLPMPGKTAKTTFGSRPMPGSKGSPRPLPNVKNNSNAAVINP